MFSDLFGPMASDTSTYQAFKIWFTSYLPFGRNEVHVVLGFIALGAAWVFVRSWRRAAWIALAITFVLGTGMELLDRRDDIAALGEWRFWTSVVDLFRTMAAPILVLGLIFWRDRKHRKVRPS